MRSKDVLGFIVVTAFPKIALHVASTYGGAQFYIGCAQANVVNGGSGNPGPLVAIPGVYTGVSIGPFDIYYPMLTCYSSMSLAFSSTSTTFPRTLLAIRPVSDAH